MTMSLANSVEIQIINTFPYTNVDFYTYIIKDGLETQVGYPNYNIGKGYKFNTSSLIYGCALVDSGLLQVKAPMYDPTRDAGHSIIYWKVDSEGLSHGYDNKSWKFDTRWKPTSSITMTPNSNV